MDKYSWMFVGVLIALISLVVGLGITAEWYACKTQTTMMNKVYSYGPVQGCMLRHKGEWIPLEKYRVLD